MVTAYGGPFALRAVGPGLGKPLDMAEADHGKITEIGTARNLAVGHTGLGTALLSRRSCLAENPSQNTSRHRRVLLGGRATRSWPQSSIADGDPLPLPTWP
jgi:hypothetical protein